MAKLTIKEYATNEGITVQSVYQKIKRGTLKSLEENGIKYVVTEETIIKREEKSALKHAFKIIKRLQQEVKAKDKEIKRLTRQNEKQNSFLISKYENALPKPHKPHVDVDTVHKNKKSKPNKRKKK